MRSFNFWPLKNLKKKVYETYRKFAHPSHFSYFIYLYIYLFIEKSKIIFTKLYTFLDFVLFKKGLNDRSFIALILKQKLNLHVMLIFINNYVHV